MPTLQYFIIKIWIFLLQEVEKNTSKVAPKNSDPLFFLIALTAQMAQMAQTEEFMFQIVAYRPTVYRTGVRLIITSP